MADRVSVLVVEDDADTRESLATLLRMSGHTVRIAANAATGLELAAAEAPDVVLIDIGLPKVNGYELARQLRSMTWKRRPLLLAVTGFATEDARQRGIEAGIDLHFLKPYEPAALLALLASLEQIARYAEQADECGPPVFA